MRKGSLGSRTLFTHNLSVVQQTPKHPPVWNDRKSCGMFNDIIEEERSRGNSENIEQDRHVETKPENYLCFHSVTCLMGKKGHCPYLDHMILPRGPHRKCCRLFPATPRPQKSCRAEYPPGSRGACEGQNKAVFEAFAAPFAIHITQAMLNRFLPGAFGIISAPDYTTCERCYDSVLGST